MDQPSSTLVIEIKSPSGWFQQKTSLFFPTPQVGGHPCNLIGFEIVVYGGAMKTLQLDQAKKEHLV